MSVKSGGVQARDVRDLLGGVTSNNAQAGVLITLEQATQPMRQAAREAGFYRSPNGQEYPKLQIFTVEDLWANKLPDLPFQETKLRQRKRRFEERQQRLGGF